MTFSASNIADIIHADFIGRDINSTIDHVSIDSRSLQNGASTLFFALSGMNTDAHEFIPNLIEKGVRNLVVKDIPNGVSEKANFFVVKDPKSALQELAAAYRSKFQFPIIGITGSNGKTIVKEWLNFLLAPDFNIVRSPKSYNSQVGVPLSVLSIREKHNFGIFEAGISQPGEMEKLERIIRPSIGILTNIGSAHDEGFENEDQKKLEKLRLFSNCDILIAKKELLPPDYSNRTFTWSFDDLTADANFAFDAGHEMLHLTYKNENHHLDIPFSDDASVENTIACIMTMLHLGCDIATIKRRIAGLYRIDMRLSVKDGINGTMIIDDSYSSDFQSLRIALDFLQAQSLHKKKTLILSDIFQSGLSENDLYDRVTKLISANRISRVITIGDTIARHRSNFPNVESYQSTEEFLATFDVNSISNESILIKGARQFEFEKIVALLEEKTHETVLEINLNAISHNLSFFRAKLEKATKLMVMVKAFGYGSGGFEIAKLLEHHNVDYLGVAFADEGISLRNSGIRVPIMVLNPESSSFAAIIRNGLEPEIYSLKGLRTFIKSASEMSISKYPIHIKIDTGMHRLGFQQSDIEELIQTLKTTDKISVKSILSHMATSDDLKHHEFALSQIELYDKLSSKMISELKINPIRHMLNTSGITNYSEAQYDMVRLGIGIYGVSNDTEEQKSLMNVGSLKSVISQLRNITAGESVGYGRRFIAEKPTTIATIPIGYADGIPRAWGNAVGYVTIKKQRAPIVGSICMDMLMVDVTEINCSEGDQAVIFGESPTVNEIADALHTIPYEILTGISQRVKRVFYRE